MEESGVVEVGLGRPGLEELVLPVRALPEVAEGLAQLWAAKNNEMEQANLAFENV